MRSPKPLRIIIWDWTINQVSVIILNRNSVLVDKIFRVLNPSPNTRGIGFDVLFTKIHMRLVNALSRSIKEVRSMKHKMEFYRTNTLWGVVAPTHASKGNKFTRNYFHVVVVICTLLLAAGEGRLPGSKHAMARADSPDGRPGAPVRGVSIPDYPNTVKPIDGRFPISVVDLGYSEQNPSITFGNGQQEYLVVWDQTVPEGGASAIYGRLVNSNGGFNGSRFLISPTLGYNIEPDVAYNPTDDQFLVVYRVTGEGIYGQIVTNAGDPVGSEIEIRSSGSDTFFNPAVAYSPTAGQYLVTWQVTQGTSQGIEARAVNADGTLAPGAPIAVTGMLPSDSPERPDVAYDSAIDQCLIVWQQYVSGQRDILGRAIDMAGGAHLASAPFSIFNSTDEEVKPAVAALPVPASTGGRYLVVAERLYSGTSYIDGVAVNGSSLVSPYSLWISPYPGKMPAIASNQNTQEFLVAWEHSSSSLWGCTITSEGYKDDSSYHSMSGVDVGLPAIASGSRGDYLVAAMDVFALSGYSNDIYGWFWGNRIFIPQVMH
jgi:hypothetical protein